MHPRQMRDTVIPVLPSLVNSMFSPLRVDYVSPGAARYHELFERSAPSLRRIQGQLPDTAAVCQPDTDCEPVASRTRDTRSCSLLPACSLAHSCALCC